MFLQPPSFKVKVTGLVLFSVLLPFVVFYSLSMHQFSQSLELALGQELNAKAELVANGIDRFITQRVTDAKVLSLSPLFASDDIPAISHYLRSVANANEWIDEIDLLDPSGNLITHSGADAHHGTLVGESYSINQELWNQILQTEAREVFVLETENLDTGEGPGLLFLTPVVDPSGNAIARLLLLEVNLLDIRAIVANFARSLHGEKHVYLLANDGRVMVTDHPGLTPFQRFPDLDRYPRMAKYFSEPEASGYFSYTDSMGDKVLAGYADMAEFGVNQALDWSILATAATEQIMAPVRNTRQGLVVFGLILSALMSGFAYLVSRSITKPVEKTIEAAGHFEDGDYRYRLSAQGGSEAHTLAIAFNRMAESIAGRTEELASTNQKLETEIAEREAAEKKILHQANFDALTGLPNRNLFNDRLQQAITHAQRKGHEFCILFLDLDRFKGINDTLGHSAGDKFLKTIAERLQGCFRQEDTVARLGGDEFVILLPHLNPELEISSLLRRLLESVALPVTLNNRECFSTVSIGIAQYPKDGKDSETLLRNADSAMYAAKDTGRNTYHFFSEDLNAQAVEKLELENYLRRALEKQELFLAYQPQLDLLSGKVTGVEALLRWQHPKRGLISPAKFIPLAEETGLILPIGEWVLRTACKQAMIWRKVGLPPLRMAVNISGRQFQKPDFTDMVDQVLAETGLDADALELEITESIAAHNVQQTLMTLIDLKVRDIRLSIDDFGTGYSSLSYLKNLPIDRIKIAQEFVRDTPADQNDVAIVETIIAMASNLGLEVIAEGVETREQLEFLSQRRCTEIQGYYFSRPIPADQVPHILSKKVSVIGSRTIHNPLAGSSRP